MKDAKKQAATTAAAHYVPKSDYRKDKKAGLPPAQDNKKCLVIPEGQIALIKKISPDCAKLVDVSDGDGALSPKTLLEFLDGSNTFVLLSTSDLKKLTETSRRCRELEREKPVQLQAKLSAAQTSARLSRKATDRARGNARRASSYWREAKTQLAEMTAVARCLAEALKAIKQAWDALPNDERTRQTPLYEAVRQALECADDAIAPGLFDKKDRDKRKRKK